MSSDLLNTIIAKREVQAAGVVVLDLVAADGRRLPPFEAGAHIDVTIAPGVVRQYSLCGDPADTQRYRLGILRDPASRGGSIIVHDTFIEGKTVEIGPPRNHFPLLLSAEHSILVGGGIGITPMLAMAQTLYRQRRKFTLHYCAREPSKAAFLADLGTAPFADAVRLHFDDGEEPQKFDVRRDLPAPESGVHIYICGPTGFMNYVHAACLARGFSEAQMHQEFFANDVDIRGGAFEVVMASSGKVVEVGDSQSIVEALASAGVKITVSCEQGVCGTCLCGVLEGIPDHRDVYLTDEEKMANDQILLCCSRSASPRLVLDL